MFEDYVRLKKDEFTDLLYISITLGVLFSITCTRFSSGNLSLLSTFVVFFLFLFVLLSLRLLFMKAIAYRNGFGFNMKMTYFDRYSFRFYDRVSHIMDGKPAKIVIPTVKMNKGVPMPFVSMLIYIFSLGFFIFPCLWRYNCKKIPHLYSRIKQKYEKLEGASFGIGVSNYRISKVFFGGFLFYFIFGLFLKTFEPIIGSNFTTWFMFALYWIAFTTLVPILGTEGYEFFKRGRFGWISAITVLILGMIGTLIFPSIATILIVTAISTFLVILVMLYKKMM